MRKIWIVTANRSRATIYRAESTHKLVEIKSLKHGEGHEHAKDLVSDKQGQVNNRVGFGVDAMELRTKVETKESRNFAKEIAEVLREGHKVGAFERLYLIANPPFITFLKEAMGTPVINLIQKEVHKDLTQSKGEDIREYLPPVL